MRLLAIDIGGFTQDILIFDSSQTIENCFKMVLPSPTTILARRIQAATKARRAIFFTGVNMGGGPSKRALAEHLRAGGKAYATIGAAATFDDNIDEVAKLGVIIVPAGENISTKNTEIIETRDLDLPKIERALETFGIEADFDGIAVAVFDHGAAPPGTSDRKFRFQHLEQVVNTKNELTAFAYLATEIPHHLTRMKAVAQSITRHIPILLMDTPVAAALGSLEEDKVASQNHKVLVNVGNFHTLAFHLQGNSILGFFEHHTGKLTRSKTEKLITRMVKGDLSNEEVFNDSGHGCFIIGSSYKAPFVSITGPRRVLMSGSKLKPYFATPYGDMMRTGCVGLIRAFAHKIEKWQAEIDSSLINLR